MKREVSVAQVQCKHGEIITLPLEFLTKFEYFSVLLSDRWELENNAISVPEIDKRVLEQLFDKNQVVKTNTNQILKSGLIDVLETVDFLGDDQVIKHIDELVLKTILDDSSFIPNLKDIAEEYRLYKTLEYLERCELANNDLIDICIVGGYYHFPLELCYKINAENILNPENLVKAEKLFGDVKELLGYDDFLGPMASRESQKSILQDAITKLKETVDIDNSENTAKLSNWTNKQQPKISKILSDLEGYRTTFSSDGKLKIVSGGYYSKTLEVSDQIIILDESNSIISVENSLNSRYFHCSEMYAEKPGILILCGGYGETEAMNSCEVLTIKNYHKSYQNNKKDRFIPIVSKFSIQNMPIGVGQACSAVHKNKMFVCCGQRGHRSVDTASEIQCLTVIKEDFENDVFEVSWSVIANYDSPVFRPYSEYGMNCALMNETLIIFGGQTVRTDCLNIDTFEWKRGPDMSGKRMECGVCVMEKSGCVLVFGGYDYTNGYYHDTIEVLKGGHWLISQIRMPVGLRSVGVCKSVELNF